MSLVRGEASESDDDTLLNVVKKVVCEAPESEEELCDKVLRNPNSRILVEGNLLQTRLIESNISVFNSLKRLIHSFVLSTSKRLLEIDQILLKSQVLIQSVIMSLKPVRTNAKQLHERTKNVCAVNFIPPIKIKH